MQIDLNGKTYSIPSVPQADDYRYAGELSCECSTNESFYDALQHWECDGIYDGTAGQMICFTCKKCGDRFKFHVRDFEAYANLGAFDKFVVKKECTPFENTYMAFPKINDDAVKELLSKCSKFEHEDLWYRYLSCKDEGLKRIMLITIKILSIFSHHFYSNSSLYGALRLRYNKEHKGQDTLIKYKNIVTTEFKNICEFVGEIERGNYPFQVKLWDNNAFVTYTAVVIDGKAKLKHMLKRSEVKDEIKRVSEIVKNGGAFYYKDMLDELKGNKKDNGRYLIID